MTKVKHLNIWWIVSCVQLLFFVVTKFGVLGLGAGHYTSGGWDADWYSGLSEQGYSFNGDFSQQQNVAFFPVFPILVSALRMLGLETPHASMLLCIVAAIISLVVLEKLLLRFFERSVTDYTVALFASSPFFLFLVVGYAESLFILFTFLALFFWTAKRRNVFGTGLAICLAGATKSHGLFLLAMPVLETLLEMVDAFRQKNQGYNYGERAGQLLLLIGLSSAGLMGFQLFLFLRFGDPLLYSHIQVAWGNKIAADWVHMFQFSAPLDGLSRLFQISVRDPIGVGTLFLFALPVLTVLAHRKIPRSLGLYSATMFLLIYPFTFAHADFTKNSGRYSLMFFTGFLSLVVLAAGSSLSNSATGVRNEASGNHVYPRLRLFVFLILLNLAFSFRYFDLFYQKNWVS